MLHTLSISEMRAQLDEKKTSAVEVAQHFLTRIEAQRDLNAFISVDSEATLAQAKIADATIAAGQSQLLTGIPLAHKDVFVTRDFVTTAGSKILAQYKSPFDATAIDRLSSAGAVCMGKTNMDEFAMGSSNENSFYGKVKNPWDVTRVPGGSSGGSAVAVAAGLSLGATGTDTGGSIRQPASFTGITGIKPTYGRVSRYGMIAYASSLDQGGPFARSAADCALLLTAMAGFDEKDSTSIERADEDYARLLNQPFSSNATESQPLKGLKIGVPREFYGAGLDEEVKAATQAAIAQYETLGATVVEVSLPKTELSIPTYYVIAPAEASSNLSRFDGVRYGHRARKYSDLEDMYRKTRTEGFGWEVQRRILVGTYVLSHGYYDAYYLQAQRLRRMIAEDYQNALSQCDVIMGPVAPTPAWRIGEKSADPVQMYLADIYTLSLNLAGLPGMSIPCGFSACGLPIGLQIIGNYFDEARLLQIAHIYQNTTNWHTKQATNHKE
ncbi:glutamyl-tRNA(Gln) amidotransferase subunit A [Formosimonas limnophila]|uniref:Glutamyl-tRNA(Gln) amidotransferase subunit A n=1 Tax=Formosimonas limnophila TaxID=1384487 RepID=A0A8J3CHI5_9BURK|nr:Asp-tRNA(Asn)/Glu-tRNA(Gln) amidotransferase subunit GatA [Formosimonas limnophila]GHA72318.1 glutamyl-tRNA(Gln) amidotransferase subunit A [Formosimonas limnophila]